MSAETVDRWRNPRWERLLYWACRIHSPIHWRVPTFREAWKGTVEP